MIDWTKPVQTRCGYPVEIWTTEARDTEYPVHGEFFDDRWKRSCWTRDGSFTFYEDHKENPIDLINVPEERWVNIYLGNSYSSKEAADFQAGKARIACVKFKEGDGL